MSYYLPPSEAVQIVPPVIDGVPVHPEVHAAYLSSLKYRVRTDEFVLKQESLDQIDTIVKEVEQQVSREPVIKKEVIQVPGPVGRVATVVKRLPTPEPDVLIKEFVIQPQKDTVNVIVEKPVTPPPRFEQKQVVEDPGLPLINHKIVQVPSSTYVPAPISPLAPHHHHHAAAAAAVFNYQDLAEGILYPHQYASHKISHYVQSSDQSMPQKERENESRQNGATSQQTTSASASNADIQLSDANNLTNAELISSLIRLNPTTSIFDVYGQN